MQREEGHMKNGQMEVLHHKQITSSVIRQKPDQILPQSGGRKHGLPTPRFQV